MYETTKYFGANNKTIAIRRLHDKNKETGNCVTKPVNICRVLHEIQNQKRVWLQDYTIVISGVQAVTQCNK